MLDRLFSKIRGAWRAKRTQFFYRHLPGLIDWIVAQSTKPAERKLDKIWSRKILLDSSVRGHAISHETGWIDTGKEVWGGIPIDTGYISRIPVHSEEDNSEIVRCVRYLGPIASLARRGKIALLESPELVDEILTQPAGRFSGYGICDYSLFHGVNIDQVSDPDYTFLIAPKWTGIPDLKEQRRERLNTKNNDLYVELRRVLGEKSSQDAWHIATAEENGCFCFLTMDFKLIRSVRAQARNRHIASLRTRIMSPEEFGIEFGLRPIPPRFFSYHNASFPVEHDINWPDSKRQPRRKR